MYNYTQNQIKFLKLVNQQYASGKITKKIYKQEVKLVRNIKKQK